MNALNRIVCSFAAGSADALSFSSNGLGMPNIEGPAHINMAIANIWYNEIPIIYLHITLFNTSSVFLTGLPFNTETWGGSVDRASAPNASMIRLSHNSYGTFNGDLPRVADPKNTNAMQLKLAVI